MKSWFPIPANSHFSIHNLPFGIISTAQNPRQRPAVAIGDHALDLAAFTHGAGFSKLEATLQHKITALTEPATLNAFAALGRPHHRAIRQYLQDVLRDDTPFPEILKSNPSLQQSSLIPLASVTTHLPLQIGDYTDFFAGRNHAANVGSLFRGAANALNPNYNHLPVAYHGRASSVVNSGTPLHRPWGQVLPTPGAATPVFKPCGRLDMELELGMFISRPNDLGSPVPVDDAEEQHIFGYVLMNDWSARDVQQWEYVPLGPFNAKNFGTTISSWVVLADALEPFRCSGLVNEVGLQSYLKQASVPEGGPMIDIQVEVSLTTSAGDTTVLTKTSSRNLLWSWPQMLAHHTVTGCNLRTGDLLGSGTISGDGPGTYGSLLEQTQGGKVAIKLEGGQERRFVEDGDTVTITGWAGSVGDGDGGVLVGFGECVGKILPAKSR